jgi:hypothetical protein
MTPTPGDPNREEVEKKVEENRELFEDLAGSDLPIVEDYQRVLDYVDEEERPRMDDLRCPSCDETLGGNLGCVLASVDDDAGRAVAGMV